MNGVKQEHLLELYDAYEKLLQICPPDSTCPGRVSLNVEKLNRVTLAVQAIRDADEGERAERLAERYS